LNFSRQLHDIHLALHQQAADELGNQLIGWAGEECLGVCWEGLSGYGNGYGEWAEAIDISSATNYKVETSSRYTKQ